MVGGVYGEPDSDEDGPLRAPRPASDIHLVKRPHSDILNAYKAALLIYKQTLDRRPSRHVQSILGKSRLLELIEDAQKKKIIWDTKSLRRRVFNKLSPLLRFISRYTKVVDGLVQLHPLPTSLIWGGIKFLVTFLGDYADYHTELLDMLEELGERFERLYLYTKILEHERLNAAVLDACIHLLSLLRMVNGVFTESGLCHLKSRCCLQI